MSFEREWTVRFSDADPFGIAHYPRILAAVHGAAAAFVESVGFPFWDLVGERGLGLPIVAVDASFERPVEAGDVVTIRLRTDLGRASVCFDYEATVDGRTVFTASERRACVPVDGDEAVEIPDDLRAALATAEPGTADGSG